MVNPQVSFTIFCFLVGAMLTSYAMRKDIIGNIAAEITKRANEMKTSSQIEISHIVNIVDLFIQESKVIWNVRSFMLLPVAQLTVNLLLFLATLHCSTPERAHELSDYQDLLTLTTFAICATGLALLSRFILHPFLTMFKAKGWN